MVDDSTVEKDEKKQPKTDPASVVAAGEKPNDGEEQHEEES